MRRFVFVLVVLIVTLSSANAQRLWVSAQGASDNNACTMTSPCATFAGVLSRLQGPAEIVCLTSGNFGGGLIQFSVTIDCSGVHAIGGAFTTQAADTAVIVLRELDLDCTNISTSCISHTNGGTLILDHVKVSNSSNAGALSGLVVAPHAGVTAKLVVTESIFTHNGDGTGGAGIKIAPAFSGSAQVSIDRTVLSGNTFGIAFDTSQYGAGINATVSNTSATSNTNDGIVATTGGKGAIGVTVKNSQLVNNGFGIRSIGTTAVVRVESTAIVGNVTGVSALSGGTLQTLGNNIVQANGTDGVFTSSVPLN